MLEFLAWLLLVGTGLGLFINLIVIHFISPRERPSGGTMVAHILVGAALFSVLLDYLGKL